MIIRILCLPDVDKPIGGVKQLYRHGEILGKLGYDARVIVEDSEFKPSWFDSCAKRMDIKSFVSEFNTMKDDTVMVVPETYIGIDFSNFYGIDATTIKKVIFNQNAYYTFGKVPSARTDIVKGFYKHESVVQIFTVSKDSTRFLKSCLGVDDQSVSRIINGIEDIFEPARQKDNVICWMPRKNSNEVESVLHSLKTDDKAILGKWTGKVIDSMGHSQVAEMMSAARIFLAFGHPEGFGLPIAEAMASGCYVIGYSGQGGSELFGFGAASRIEYGDWRSFSEEILRIAKKFDRDSREIDDDVEHQRAAVRSIYSCDREVDSIKRGWDNVSMRLKR